MLPLSRRSRGSSARRCVPSRRTFSFEALESRLTLSTADPAIAFINWTSINRVSYRELTVMNADGSNQTVVWSAEASQGYLADPAWSPDRDGDPSNGFQGSIVVTRDATWDGRNDVDLWVINVEVTTTGVQGGIPRLLAKSALDPAWSPEGNLIAYAAASPTFDGIAVVSPDGITVPPTLVFPVDPSIEAVNRPTWSPDGTRVAFVYFGGGSGRDRLWVKQVVDPNTGALITSRDAREVIPPNVLPSSSILGPDWGKGGSVVAFENGSKIYTIDVDATVPLNTLRTIPTGTKWPKSPTWSPDDTSTPADETDKFIAFEQAGAKSKIVRLEMATGTKIVLREGSPHQPDWRRFPSTFVSTSSTTLAATPSSTSTTMAAGEADHSPSLLNPASSSEVRVRLLSPKDGEVFHVGQKVMIHGLFNGAPMPEGANAMVDVFAQSILDGSLLIEVHTDMPVNGNQFQYSFSAPNEAARICIRVVFRDSEGGVHIFRRIILVEAVAPASLTTASTETKSSSSDGSGSSLLFDPAALDQLLAEPESTWTRKSRVKMRG